MAVRPHIQYDHKAAFVYDGIDHCFQRTSDRKLAKYCNGCQKGPSRVPSAFPIFPRRSPEGPNIIQQTMKHGQIFILPFSPTLNRDLPCGRSAAMPPLVVYSYVGYGTMVPTSGAALQLKGLMT